MVIEMDFLKPWDVSWNHREDTKVWMVNFEVALITATARETKNGVRDVAYSDSWPSGSSIKEAVRL